MSVSAKLRQWAGAATLGMLIPILPIVATEAPAAQGDCSQPLSNGPVPVATDCLYILNAAVLLQTCTPQCICAPTGELPISATDALACLQKAVGHPIRLQCPCGSGTSTSTTTSSTRLETTTTMLDTTTTTVFGGLSKERARRGAAGVCKLR